MNKETIIHNLKSTNRFELFKNILDSKNYDELYTMFGKTVYMLFTPHSYKKQDIIKLMDNDELGTIYNKYGNMETLFIKNFRRRKKEDIKKLLSEKKYIDIYSKYGESEYNKHTNTMYKNDIEYETGSKFKAKLYSNKKKIAKGIEKCTEALALITTLTISLIGYEGYVYVNDTYNKALLDNSVLLQEYNDKINMYADNIHNLNLDNDLDIVMKVLDDMWSDMGGYGEPTLDEFSLGRLAFAKEKGIGVCRNIADDFSARMNAINPEYNARNVAVYIDFNKYNDNSLANIDRNVIESNDTVIDNIVEDNANEIESFVDNMNIEKVVGNHMVSIFEPIGKDYTLVVDATNPSIGVIANGEIYLFANNNGEGLDFKPLGQMTTIVNYKYTDVEKEFSFNFLNYINNEELQSMDEEWGIEAQNESLEKLRQNNKTI